MNCGASFCFGARECITKKKLAKKSGTSGMFLLPLAYLVGQEPYLKEHKISHIILTYFWTT